MQIHFLGLSSFLIENTQGFRILIDPFNDSPGWSLGPTFPKEFQGKPFGANLVLSSEPDADHSYSPGDWLQFAPETKPNSNPFPNLDLRGTVIYEWNGDLNIAWHYTIDGIRLAHFADNAHLLTDEQLSKIGTPDIIFISPPKTENKEANEVVRQNIARLKPKCIFWAHHIAPSDLPETSDSETLRMYFANYFRMNANTSKHYQGEKSFMELCYVFEHAILLNQEYGGVELNVTQIEISQTTLNQTNKPHAFLFRKMVSKSTTE